MIFAIKDSGDYLEHQDGDSTNEKTESNAPKGAETINAREPQARGHSEQKHTPVFELVSNSGNPEAKKIKEDIDAVRKNRQGLIDQIKAVKRRLSYKMAEAETIDKFLEMEPDKNYEDKMKKVRMLKKQKERLEFRISTEASSLSDEKALIRKIKELSVELDKYLRIVKLVRKRDLVKSDIIEYSKKADELNSSILTLDRQLDDLYSNLRKILKIERPREQHPQKKRPPKKEQQMMQEVNLEDIVVIKKKK